MPIEVRLLDKVLNDTIYAIENGKRQIFDISEHARAEYNHIKEELEKVKREVSALINQVDNLTREEKRSRLRLAEVSRNFHSYNEEDIKQAYVQAQENKLRLADLMGQEQLLRYKRDHLERNLLNIQELLLKAEKLASHLTAVNNYLNSDFTAIHARIAELEQIQQLGVSVIRAQEEERRKLARDIHDGPAQLLANIVMRAEFCLKLMEIDHNRVKGELVALQDMVRQSLKDVRKIIFDLRPMVLDDLGLVPAIKRYLEEFQAQYGIQAELAVIGDPGRFAMPVEVALFRVFQECLNNIKKHSKATHVLIKVEILPQKVNMVVKDNGIGFIMKSIITDLNRDGYGLIGMRERIQILKGEMVINSSPGQGTQIHVSVPVDK